MDRMSQDITTEAPYLVYESERRAYPLSEGSFTIGRDAGSNIVIREPTVSRLHAEIRPEGDEYKIHPTGATITRVNGESVSAPTELTDGDRIEIGSAEFTFRRGRLPLGVSIVDMASPAGHDPDVMTRRVTITNPILGGGKEDAGNKKSFSGTIILFVVLIAAATYYFVMR